MLTGRLLYCIAQTKTSLIFIRILKFTYLKLLQSDEQKCLTPNQCDNSFIFSMLHLTRHLNQVKHVVLSFLTPLPSIFIISRISVTLPRSLVYFKSSCKAEI